jgi:DNA-binding MarR family transcriptional regulator
MKSTDAVDDPSLKILNSDPRPWVRPVAVSLLRFQYRLERRLVSILAIHGLSQPQFDVLANLVHGDGITQQELTDRLLMTKGNLVGIIDRASASGWLERRPDLEDRRANRIFLTEAGRAIIERAKPCVDRLLNQVFGSLSAGELHLMSEMIGRLDRSTRNLKLTITSDDPDQDPSREGSSFND